MQRQAGAGRVISWRKRCNQPYLPALAQVVETSKRSRTGLPRCRPSHVLEASPTVDHPSLTIGGHPDAIRRRKEAEERARKKALERERQAANQSEGLKWWQDSPYVATLPTPHALLELLDRLPASRLVVVKFFTEECYSCKSFNPKLQSIASNLPDVTFVKINGSNPGFQAFFEATGIVSVPWFHFYKGGRRVASMTASLNPQRLAAFRSELAIQRGVQQPALIPSAPY